MLPHRDDLIFHLDAVVATCGEDLSGALNLAISPRAFESCCRINRQRSATVSLILRPLAAVYRHLPVDVLVHSVPAADALDPLTIVPHSIRIFNLTLAVRAAEVVTLARVAILKAVLTRLVGLIDCV